MEKIEEQLNYQYQFSVENIRKRPGMYVWNTTIMGIYKLIFDLTEDIISNNNGADICITINLIKNDTLIFMCESSMNDGLCLEVVKALSDIFEISLGNKQYIYNKGVLVSEKNIADNRQGLLKIMFRPDKEIFSYKKLDYYMIFKNLKELAQLNENVKFILSNNKNKNILQFHDGLAAMLNETHCFGLGSRKPLNFNFTKDDIEVSVSVVYGGVPEAVLSYVNNLRTIDGGTHVKGLYDGIFHAFKKYIQHHVCENIKILKKIL